MANKMQTKYQLLMLDPEFQRLMAIESLATETSEMIAGLMEKQGLSKADLARRLNKSRAWATQLLSGKANLTVRTLAEVAFALGAEVEIHANNIKEAPVSKASFDWERGPEPRYFTIGRRDKLPNPNLRIYHVSDSPSEELEYAA